MSAPVILASPPPSPITTALLLASDADPGGAGKYGPYLAASANKRGVTSANGTIALLGNVLNESGGFKCISEDMFYRSAEWLAEVFSSHFPGGAAQAQPYTCNARALGNRVYAEIGRAEGGYAARGLGLGQITGDAVHSAYGKDVGKSLADVRAYLLTPEGAADSAVWYFVSHGCGPLAEAGDFLGVRQRWAGRNVPNPMGWSTVQKWSEQVRLAMGLRPAHPIAHQVTSLQVASNDSMFFPSPK